MINDDILAVKDCILNSIGSTCEKIYLFGSYAKGTQRKDSDYDFFVLFRDGSQHPMLSLQQINRGLTQRRMTVPVDVLGNYQSRFDALKHSPTIEKTVADEGILLYERP
jgi:predicted nucleotidyltransferase